MIARVLTDDRPDEILRDHQTGKLVTIGVFNIPSNSYTLMMTRTTTTVIQASYTVATSAEIPEKCLTTSTPGLDRNIPMSALLLEVGQTKVALPHLLRLTYESSGTSKL